MIVDIDAYRAVNLSVGYRIERSGIRFYTDGSRTTDGAGAGIVVL